MTETELSLLKASIDQVVDLETTRGERHLAQILFVFDEGETPDVFYLKVAHCPGGGFVAQGPAAARCFSQRSPPSVHTVRRSS